MTKYNTPEKECDIIMKGGITSGIVYPSAVCELANHFKFRQIGGTSAGAIAAGLTAAAEVGRNLKDSNELPENFDENNVGFSGVAKIPHFLGSKEEGSHLTKLFTLFQPQKDTKNLFDLFVMFLGREKFKWAKAPLIMFKINPIYNITGAIPAFLLIIGLFCLLPLNLSLYNLFNITGIIILLTFSTILLLIGILIASLFNTIKEFLLKLPENYFGMCTGFKDDYDENNPPLTIWLNNIFKELAGKESKDEPLTFGDLETYNVDLQMITTCLTQQCPYRLPFKNDLFCYKEEDFRKLFPKEVVDFMITHEKKEDQTDSYKIPEGFHKFPENKYLPIVVAVRMSLSFPVLISAIPLYTIDFTRKTDSQILERCWFSDGGIISNFPIHFFDSILPTRPTFGINLKPFNIDYEKSDKQCENVYMPSTNIGGNKISWNRFDDTKKGFKLINFAWAIINSMQNWNDSMQSTMPGYRDRIVNVFMTNDEGGLNLDMPETLISNLSERGKCAGLEIIKHYTKSSNCQTSNNIITTWENHQWVRYRTALSEFEKLLEKLVFGINNNSEFVHLSNNPPSYKWKNGQKQLSDKMVQGIQELISIINSSDSNLKDGSPKPEPELQAKPDV